VGVDELVAAAQRGDPWAMQALLRELAPYVGRICGAIALDEGDDAMQETMIAVFRNLRTLRDPGALRGWVRQIAVRESVRQCRRDGRTVANADLSHLPADGHDPSVDIDVRATLRQLAPDQRAILVLRDVEGFTEEEAARALDVAPGTVKSRLHRARVAFRRRWEA
jgi:RNA polymerase sigma-70 factor (ECF subfamily)